MPSEVPDVMSTRSAETSTPRAAEVGGRRFARRHDAGRGGIAVVAVAHGPGRRLDEVGRRDEAERNRIADVQVPHDLAGGLHLPGLGHHLSDRVGEPADARGGADRRRNRAGHVARDLSSPAGASALRGAPASAGVAPRRAARRGARLPEAGGFGHSGFGQSGRLLGRDLSQRAARSVLHEGVSLTASRPAAAARSRSRHAVKSCVHNS